MSIGVSVTLLLFFQQAAQFWPFLFTIRRVKQHIRLGIYSLDLDPGNDTGMSFWVLQSQEQESDSKEKNVVFAQRGVSCLSNME